MLQGRFTEARELAGALLPYGEQTGERWGIAALLTIDAIAAAELGDVVVGASEAERARLRFAELGDPWGQAMALVAAGISARGAGQPERAVTFLETAVALTESGGFPVVGALATVALGYARLDRDDVDGARGQRHRGGGPARGPRPRAAGHPRRARAPGPGAASAGAAARGARRARPRRCASAGDSPALLFPRRQALAHRAGILLELERPEEALAAAEAAVASPAEDVRSQVMALRALGSCLRATGDEEAATAALTEALEVARSTDQRSEIAATERLLQG